MNLHTTRICLFGCGRWLRRDDQTGLLIAQALAQEPLPDVTVLLSEAPVADLPSSLDGVDLLIVVDAARPTQGRRAGSWQRIDYRREPDRLVDRPPTLDAHQPSVDVGLRLADELGLLPKSVWLYTVAAADCGYGEDLAPGVRAAVSELVERIPRDIEVWRREQRQHA